MTSKANQETDRQLQAAIEAAKRGDGQAPMIQPQPLPNSIQVGSSDNPIPIPQGDGTVKHVRFVILQHQTPAGQGFLWMEPDQADQVAEGLKKAAQAQRAGIVLA